MNEIGRMKQAGRGRIIAISVPAIMVSFGRRLR